MDGGVERLSSQNRPDSVSRAGRGGDFQFGTGAPTGCPRVFVSCSN